MAIDVEDLKKLTPKQKALLVLLVCLVIGYLYYTFFLQDGLAKRQALNTQLADLQQQVVEKERAVAQLERYVREINVLRESFKTALMKLPNEREIAGLLSSVVLSGKGAGVDFLLFEPKPPEKKPPEPKPAAAKPPEPKPAGPEKFYEEIPIKVQLSGAFHNTVYFFDQVARLPRIVNIEDITMADAKEVRGRGWVVRTSCTVKTYMFVERK